MSYTDLIDARVAMNDDEFEDSLEIAAAADDAEPTAEPEPVLKPGDPEYDWQAQYPGERVFVYTASTGKTVGLAELGGKRKPNMGALRRLRKADHMDQMWTVLEWVASPAALSVSDQFDDVDYGQMFEQWSEWSKTSVGESLR